jgi:hypothetical protein
MNFATKPGGSITRVTERLGSEIRIHAASVSDGCRDHRTRRRPRPATRAERPAERAAPARYRGLAAPGVRGDMTDI